jgi:hypothetical protein
LGFMFLFWFLALYYLLDAGLGLLMIKM